MCICLYAYVCSIYVYVLMCLWLYACMCLCAYICIYVGMHFYVFVHLYVYTCVCCFSFACLITYECMHFNFAYICCERRVIIFVHTFTFCQHRDTLYIFFVGSCLFKGTYHGPFLFFLIFSLSIFYFTSGFVNAGASETQRLGFYTRFLL